jgi:AraC-like DNA-binding protein
MEQARTAASRPDETRPQPAVRDPVDRREATIARKQREQGFGGHGGRGKLATHLGVSPDTLRGLINQNRRKCSAKTEAKLRTKIPITADDDWPDVV